jgi:hypothetical protein
MEFAELLALLLLAAGGWLIWDSLKAREAANAAIRAGCRTEGLLFLDDTVALQSIRPVRNEDGRVLLRRVYGFEFSDTGDNRRRGSVTMVASRVAELDVGLSTAPDGTTLH